MEILVFFKIALLGGENGLDSGGENGMGRVSAKTTEKIFLPIWGILDYNFKFYG